MSNFYNEWLNYWEDEQEERAKARKCINEEELDWIRTRQDFRAALLCSRQNGFKTDGEVMLGEIPGGWNTGKHSHGEEAIFIIQGSGFSVVDNKRYDWEAGSCLFMPFGSIHQHFNTGDTTVSYLSAMSLALERFVGIARLVQYEEARETPMDEPQGVEKAESEVHPEYGRIVLRAKDTVILDGAEERRRESVRKDGFYLSMAKEMNNPNAPPPRSRAIPLMALPEHQFKPTEIEMTHILIDDPGKQSVKHGHMEAVLYVLQGEGYSVVNDEKVSWKKGTLLQVQGPQTTHQHFNTGQTEARQLRIHFGTRFHFFQPITKRVFPYLYFEHSSNV